MLKDLWPNLAKGAAGFLLGLALWWGLSAPYARLLATMTEPLIRMVERPAVTRLIAGGTELTIDRDDFPRSSPRPGLTLMDLTANIILLTTLFAVNKRPVSDRNIRGFVLASLALAAVHIAAIIVNMESIYALRLGPWSERNYSAFARNFWGAAAHFYSIIGVFGAGFALWWLFRPSNEVPQDSGKSGQRKTVKNKRVPAR
ncbi:MAG TPA: hypothetical protein VHX14_11355 [Thermoanaerobaculia bacterium]|nr:hypothetical protein [Thermoanaerobaculia bacterium]